MPALTNQASIAILCGTTAENFITAVKEMKKRFGIGDTIKELEKFYYLLMEGEKADDRTGN